MCANGLILDLESVSYRWSGQPGFGLTIPSFSLAVGETVLLLGESGCGKSTLLSLICGTILPDQGRVTVAGRNIAELPGAQRDQYRAEKIGMIFQQFNLLPFGSVTDNIVLPLRFAPQRRARVGKPKQAAADLCAALGLPEMQHKKAAALSVGQQQRVAVARALIGQPPLILADEPTSALDESNQDTFLDLMFEQVRKHRTSLLMVSHDPRLAVRFDRVVKMTDITEHGAQAE